jgi:ABC-type branched-subunit amino acid transport system substrate-binding protein
MPEGSNFPTLVRLTDTFEVQARFFVQYLVAASVQGENIAVIGDASAPGKALLLAIGRELVSQGIDNPNITADNPALIAITADPARPLPSPGTDEAKPIDGAADLAATRDVIFLAGYPPTVDWLATRIRARTASAKIIVNDTNLAQDRTPAAADLLILFPLVQLRFDGDPAKNAAIISSIDPSGNVGPAAYFTYAALQLWAAGEETASDPWSAYAELATQPHNTAIGPIQIDSATGTVSGRKFGLFRWNGSQLTDACPPECIP